MDSYNLPFSSFTITQPFLGAPLQFIPALGSAELEQLIDAFVTGSSSKQDKLCEVTIDFYMNANVDLNTGALVKTYYVYNIAATSPWDFDFEQSPVESYSSAFSPITYTPSPESSSSNLADSGYASFSSVTPPSHGSNGVAAGRVVKKTKKDTKKAAEMRLPGFSIMTKDGIDVTNSAGRGTKTKEQREHAHLMRIMKACGDCKRKKVKCDPSHRREQNAMSSRASDGSDSISSSRPFQSTFSPVPSEPLFGELDLQLPDQNSSGMGHVLRSQLLQSTFNHVPSEPLFGQLDQQIPIQYQDTIDDVIPGRPLQSTLKPANIFKDIASLVKSIPVLLLCILTFFLPIGEKSYQFINTISDSINCPSESSEHRSKTLHQCIPDRSSNRATARFSGLRSSIASVRNSLRIDGFLLVD